MLIFPRICPEELLYSACARYRDLFRFPGDRAVAEDLFGSKQSTAIFDLPVGLEDFVARLPRGHSYSVEQLVRDHTILPYYAHFVASSRLDRIEDRIRSGGSGPAVRTLLGAGTGNRHVPLPSHFHFCSVCAADDTAEHGEPVWRRVHQVPGVFVCPVHGSTLRRGPVRRKDLKGVFIYHSLSRSISPGVAEVVQPETPPGRLQWLAEQSLWLVRAEPRRLTPGQLRARHRAILHDLGLLSNSGTLRFDKVTEALVQHWGSDLLIMMGSAPHPSRPCPRWIESMLRRRVRSAGDPLRHLLLVGLYGIGVEDFLDHQSAVRGGPPARQNVGECANPVCPLFSPSDERKLARRIYNGSGQPYRCNTCGCVFEDYRPSHVRFLETGSRWDQAFAEAVVEGASALELARRFGVSRRLVRCHADRLDVWNDGWGDRAEHSLSAYHAAEARLKEEKREEYLRLRRANPEMTRTQIRNTDYALFSWLQAHDNAWLLANMPEKRRLGTGPRLPSVDWHKRDTQLCQDVRAAAERLLDRDDEPVRLTRASIGREANARVLVASRDERLPMTNAFVDGMVETIDAFTRRRIRWQAARCIKENRIPTFSELLEDSGIEWRHRSRFLDDLSAQLQNVREALIPRPSRLRDAG
jgi:transposase-like protein